MNNHHHIYPGLRTKDTSMHINNNSVRRAVTLREQIYRAIQRGGSFGATAHECAELLSIPHDLVQRHITTLNTRGRIIDSSRRRISPYCSECAVVWVVSHYPHSPISEAYYGKKEAIQPTL